MTTWVMTISKHLMLKTTPRSKFLKSAMNLHFKTSYVKNKRSLQFHCSGTSLISKHLMLKTNTKPTDFPAERQRFQNILC